MRMDSKTLVLDVLRSLGQREAAELREGAADMDGTAIIAMERAAPAWDKNTDYTSWPKGAPVSEAMELTYDIECPHCHAAINVPVGQSVCPGCGGEIDLKLKLD